MFSRKIYRARYIERVYLRLYLRRFVMFTGNYYARRKVICWRCWRIVKWPLRPVMRTGPETIGTPCARLQCPSASPHRPVASPATCCPETTTGAPIHHTNRRSCRQHLCAIDAFSAKPAVIRQSVAMRVSSAKLKPTATISRHYVTDLVA